MTQDTRKDRRVKIVSLNVRYKSATVDEFIENHAHDVSRGGIYIKTANPFPPGTLLKFEIRLASDQAVIAGVGRVVWKRDAGTSNGERPAGMGVKFIKIDEPSKTVIDKLVNTKNDAGKAYESETEMPTAVIESPLAKPPPGAASPSGPPARKATMMGLGLATGSSPPPAVTPSAPPPHAATASASSPAPSPPRPSGSSGSGGGGMFPVTNAEADMPPKQEQTVMKQAAELLEEALREAGGSMEEVGTNPLFSGTGPGEAASSKASKPPVAEAKRTSSAPPAEAKDVSDELPTRIDDAAKARAMVAEISPGPKRIPSEPPRTSRESPGAKTPGRTSSVRPEVVARASEPPKKGGGGAFIVLFVAVAAVAGAAVMYRDKLFGGNADVPTSQSTAAQAVPTPPVPATTTAPTVTASAAPSAVASAAPGASASASPSASAGTAPTTTATTGSTATAAPTAKPAPTVANTTTPTATAVAPAPTPKPTATATAAPVATEPPAATATATAAPKPKPKPKPADDNPY